MSDLTVRVYVDWDYTAGATIDFTTSGDEITAYYRAADIRLGGQPGTLMAAVGTCELTLQNTTRTFSPRYSGSPYYGKMLPLKPVRVDVTDGTTTWTVFTGWTKAFSAASDRYGERRAFVSCHDWLGVVQQSNVDLPLRENVLSSQLIRDVLNYAVKSPVATARFDFSGNPASGDTVNVNGIGYHITDTPSVANDVQRGSARRFTIANLVAAINGWDNSGAFAANTTRPPLVRARVSDSYTQIIQDADPVRYYKLGETSGTVTVDLGSNLKDATINGSPTLAVTGVVTNDGDGAIRLDGTNDYIAVPTLDLSNRSFSVEFWFKAAASPSVNQDLFSVHTDFANNKSFFIRFNDGALLKISARWYGISQIDTAALTTGVWYHVATVYDASTTTLTLYLNGAVVGSVAGGPLVGSAPTIEIGAYTAAGGNYTKGDMDEAVLYLRLLSAAEIAEHYAAATTAPSPGLTVYSLLRGAVGNSFTLSESSSAITATGATLAGGVDTPTMTTSIETGLRDFPFAGDDWSGDKTNALTALTQIVESERGRAYVKRNGTFVFENYAKGFTGFAATPVLETDGSTVNDDPVVLLDNALSDEDVINSVVVQYRPRSTLSTGVVAKINTPVKVPGRWGTQSSDTNQSKEWFVSGRPIGDPGQTLVSLPYTDPDTGQRIGAKDLTLPLVAATDWTANEARDGSMVSYTSYSPQQLFFSVAEKATGCDISIKNIALGALYILTLQVRGTKITKYNQQTVTKEYPASIDLYGRRQQTVTLPLESDDNLATAIAEYELSRAATTTWRIRGVDWRNLRYDQMGTAVLNAEIGDVILIHEEQTMDDSVQVKLRIVGLTYGFGLRNEFNVMFDVEAVDEQVYGLYDDAAALYDQCAYTI